MAAKKKAQNLKLTLADIEKRFGEGTIRKLGSGAMDYEGIPTGIPSLDIALGGKGLPCGRISEVYGPESSGKTTLALSIIAQAQKQGDTVAFIDAEHALNTQWADTLGVDTDELLVSQPNSGEDALEICDMLVDSKGVGLVVVDSVSALTPKAEIEGEMGDSHMGLQARLMSQAMRKLTPACAKNNVAILFINQIRMKIGVMFGNPETTSGGRALRFYASVRMDLRRITTMKGTEGAIGIHVRCRIKKNKVASPFKDAEFDIMFDSGISYEGDLLDLASKAGIVTRSGAWYNYGKTRLGQGREKAKTFLVENPKLSAELLKKVT